jgi:hypothetical protein
MDLTFDQDPGGGMVNDGLTNEERSKGIPAQNQLSSTAVPLLIPSFRNKLVRIHVARSSYTQVS